MICLLRTVLPLDKRRFLLFLLGIFLGSVLIVFAQDNTVKQDSVLVPETQDKVMLDVDTIFAEELKPLSVEWKNSLFTAENVSQIKAKVRKALPNGTEGMSEGSWKALIRKSVKGSIYGTMTGVVVKGTETVLLDLIETLPSDWRDLALTGDNTGKILQQATGDMDFKFLNSPKKERDAALLAKLKQEIIKFEQTVTMSDTAAVFSEAFNQWPEALKEKADPVLRQSAVKFLVDEVLKKSTPGMARKDIKQIAQKEVPGSLLRILQILVEGEITEVISRETTGMGPGLTDALIVNEKVLKGLIDEIQKSLSQSAGTASAQKDPLSLYKSATEKVRDVVQKIFMREKEKLATQCMKEPVPENVAISHEKYWLLFPLPDKASKEQETFPYIDERYYNCKAVAENNLNYCLKFKFPGREEHDVACKVYSLLYLKILPAIAETKEYPEELVNELYALDPTVGEKKAVLETLLRAFAEKNASRCEPMKGKDDNWYPVCRSAVSRDLKACTGAAFPENCKQNSLAFESVLYNDDTKLKSIAFDDIVSSFPLLAKVHFDKNTCSSFYKEEIMKRYCNNLYMYKPAKKEVKKDEKEEKQK